MSSGKRANNGKLFLVVLLFTFFIYAAFLTRSFYWDGVLFSLYIEGVSRGEYSVPILFHPNHLLYSALGYLVYEAAALAGLHWRAITVLQAINVVASAATGYLVFRVAQRYTRSGTVSLACFILFAFGATWWKFSTDADAYILSVLLLLLAVASAIDEKIVAASLLHAGAMLFHELAVFGAVPILVALLMKRRLRAAGAYLLLSSVPVLIVYAIAYRFSSRGLHASFLGWLTSSSSESKTTHTLGQLIGASLSSYLKLFAGGRWSLIQQFLSPVVVISFAICFALIVYAVWLWQRPRMEASAPPDKRPTMVLWTWVLPYLLFLSWFEPGNAFYKLFIWPPIVLLFGIEIASRPALRERAGSFLAITLALMAWNFGAFIFPHSHSASDPVLALAEKVDKELPKRAIVYYRAFDPDDWYLRYFAPGRKWEQVPADLSSVKRAGSTVCFETTALPSVPMKMDLARRWDLVNGKHNVRLECLPK